MLGNVRSLHCNKSFNPSSQPQRVAGNADNGYVSEITLELEMFKRNRYLFDEIYADQQR